MNTPKVTTRIPQDQLDQIDLLIKNKLFGDRSAFIRRAITQLLEEFEGSLREAAQ